MNILFYSYNKPVPSLGGVERVTDIVAEGLSEFNYRCYVVYEQDIHGACNKCFISHSLLPKDNRLYFLKEYVYKKNIDIIIIQGKSDTIQLFKDVTSFFPLKLIYVLHSDPGYGYDTFNLDTLRYEFSHSTGLLKLHKFFIILFFPLYKLKVRRLLSTKYKKIYTKVDKFILLSESAIDYFIKLSGIHDLEKITVIGNPLTYQKNLNLNEYSKKENKVLIVSRMEEHSKKISYALKAWKLLEKRNSMGDWELDIVGDGEDLVTYKEWVKKNNLQRVNFYGSQDPLPYYRKSSIFVMSSISEAWGMTITEALQQMCVPVAFNSYCAISDIIKNNINGILVKFPSIIDLAQSIAFLAENDQVRMKMAINGRNISNTFSKEQIAEKWNNLFKTL